MPSARQIKRRISASQNISKITKAMEMVAASKMKRAQDQAVATRPYSTALHKSLLKLGSFTVPDLHPLLAQPTIGSDAIVVIATDKGLCGGLNTNLFKALMNEYRQATNPQIIVVGRKAVAFAKLLGLPIYAQFIQMPDKISAKDALPISTLVIQKFLDGTFKSVKLIYTDFINTLSQQVKTTPLLPLTKPTEYSDDTMVVPQIKSEYAFEPSPEEILSQLLPYYIENTVYQSFLEAKASEHSARMVAMKNASENASELVGELKLIFNKSRQASITSELLDITTSALTITK
jgi:F-type H+-transporting ATPase subunit gamma